MGTCHLFKHTECTNPELNPNVNYALGVMMTSQCWFINCNKCSIVGGMFTVEEAVCERTVGVQELSMLLSPFCGEPKAALKIAY